MKKTLLGILFSLIIIMPFAISFGVSSEYWNDNPLNITKGETKTVTFLLQNMVDGQDMTVDASIDARQLSAKLITGTQYFVPIGRKDIEVKVELTAPKNATAGMTELSVIFIPVKKTEGGGTVQLVGVTQKNIPVLVLEAESKEEIDIGFIIVVTVILLAIAVLLYLGRKKKNEK